MKNITAACFVLVLFTACTKTEYYSDIKKYAPEVEMVSAEVQDDGTILVKGRVTKAGGGEIEFGGFCMDTTPNPSKNASQVLLGVDAGSTFECVYESGPIFDFDFKQKYYFKAFVKNSFSWAESNVVMVDSVTPVSVQAPCNPDSLFIDAGFFPDTQRPMYTTVNSASMDEYAISVFGDNTRLQLIFNKKPRNGKYKTVGDMYVFDKQVKVLLYNNFQWIAINPNQEIFVKQLNDKQYTITICDVIWVFNPNGRPSDLKLTAELFVEVD